MDDLFTAPDSLCSFPASSFLPQGGAVSSRVVESYLWECKQLGAYSPIVLLNTLLFFCTKTFHFRTLAQHQSLSFANFTRCSKPCNRAGKVHYLRYHRRIRAAPYREETGGCSGIIQLYSLQVFLLMRQCTNIISKIELCVEIVIS